MKVLSFLNEKGGVGKSTLATNIATALHREGKKVLLIDADPQATSMDWRAASPKNADLPPVFSIDRPKTLVSTLGSLQADIVVIDAPAKAEGMAAAIVRISDIALIVMQPSGADVWASAAAVKLVQARRDVGGAINAAILVNRVRARTKLSKLIEAGDWNDYEIKQLKSAVGDRVAFAQAITEGVSVFDLADANAKSEVLAILAELKAEKWL